MEDRQIDNSKIPLDKDEFRRQTTAEGSNFDVRLTTGDYVDACLANARIREFRYLLEARPELFRALRDVVDTMRPPSPQAADELAGLGLLTSDRQDVRPAVRAVFIAGITEDDQGRPTFTSDIFDPDVENGDIEKLARAARLAQRGQAAVFRELFARSEPDSGRFR
jgi:hypothetical protein